MHAGPLHLFTTVARHHRLSRWWLPFAGTLLLRGALPRADAELVILRTAVNCRCSYEWIQHALLARRAHLTPAEIGAAADPGSPALGPRQRLLVQAVDELHSDKAITDGTWAGLAAQLDERQLIELCFLVGHYEMVAMVVNSLGVEPEQGVRRRLDTAAGATADRLTDLRR